MSAGYLHQCGRKRRYLDKDAAEKHRRRLVDLGVWTLLKSNTYRCTQCGCWHAGRTGTKFRGKGRGSR